MDDHFQAFNVFNCLDNEWRPSPGTTRDFWIQIQCPDKIKIHKFTLRGRNNLDDSMLGWRLQASNDNNTWIELYRGIETTINRECSTFHVSPDADYYNYYRFLVKRAVSNPGLSHWQLYTAEKIM